MLTYVDMYFNFYIFLQVAVQEALEWSLIEVKASRAGEIVKISWQNRNIGFTQKEPLKYIPSIVK